MQPKHFLRHFKERAEALLSGHANTIANFRNPNMPWAGERCRSTYAGLSGVAYALPGCFCPIGSWEPLMWMMTAFLSCQADYFHIHHDSVYHGLDRCFASLVMARCLLICAVHLPTQFFLLAALPLFCFVKGRDAKLLPDPSGWIFWHTCWHVSGGMLVAVGTWMLHCSSPAAAGLSMGGAEIVALG